MFADIRNFSGLCQVFRLTNRSERLRDLLQNYSQMVSKVVGSVAVGRVDKFLGDGALAFFGEYLGAGNDVGKVAAAAYCAFELLQQFEAQLPGLLSGWVGSETDGDRDRGPGLARDYRRMFNENVEVRLAIGINLGEVLFDYLGAKPHIEYTGVGDHVNFAQRLEDAACQYDESLGRLRANVLISQTAYFALRDGECLVRPKDMRPLWLPLRGLGLLYPVYELRRDDLDYNRLYPVVQGLRGIAD